MRRIKEKDFIYKGYRCLISFSNAGYRCGYVAIPKGHKLYGKDYDELMDIDCHGGLTYSKNYMDFHPYNSSQDLWWIGFDCNHYGDGHDFATARKYFSDEESLLEINRYESFDDSFLHLHNLEAISLEECIEECKNIVNQIEEMG